MKHFLRVHVRWSDGTHQVYETTMLTDRILPVGTQLRFATKLQTKQLQPNRSTFKIVSHVYQADTGTLISWSETLHLDPTPHNRNWFTENFFVLLVKSDNATGE